MKSMLTSRVIQFHTMPLTCDHDHLRIVFVLDGECDVKRFGKISHFCSQEAFFIEAHQVCVMHSEQGCVIEETCISLEALERAGTYCRNLPMVDSISGMDQKKEITQVYRDCVFLKDLLQCCSASDTEEELLVDKIVNALMTDYNALNYEQDQYRYVNEDTLTRFCRVMQYIREHKEQKLTLQNAADAEGVQKNYFALLFKQVSGMTYLECVNRIRLMQAEEILLLEDCSNAEIIRRCGFTDSKYFYRYFLQTFDATPVSWKNRWKNYPEADGQILGTEDAQKFLNQVYDELTMINTDTHFYQQYCLLKELEKRDILPEPEIDLFHPENILTVDGSSVNTWYGLDLIMGFVKAHDLPVTLKIRGDGIADYEEDLLAQIDKAVLRYDTKLLHSWSFRIWIKDPEELEPAEKLMKKLAEKLPYAKCSIIC